MNTLLLQGDSSRFAVGLLQELFSTVGWQYQDYCRNNILLQVYCRITVGTLLLQGDSSRFAGGLLQELFSTIRQQYYDYCRNTILLQGDSSRFIVGLLQDYCKATLPTINPIHISFFFQILAPERANNHSNILQWIASFGGFALLAVNMIWAT